MGHGFFAKARKCFFPLVVSVDWFETRYCPGCFTKVMEAMKAAVSSESLSVNNEILSGRTLRAT